MAATRVLGRRLATVVALGALLLASSAQAPAAAPSGAYRVSGNTILDPSGRPFIVKGANALAGHFLGPDAGGYSTDNYTNAQRDLDNLKAAGVNTVRVLTSYSSYTSGPLSEGDYLAHLDNVVSWITQRGMVAEIGQGWAGAQANVVTMSTMLATRYKSNPQVWLNPDNEPNCNSGDTSKCYDWGYWQLTQTQNVQAIRNAGFTNPIVIDGTGWSWDLSQIGSYPLGDANIIYAAHLYGGGASTWNAYRGAWTDYAWGNLATTYPIFLEELGYDSGGTLSPVAWCASFLDSYAVNWVLNRQGSGVMAWTDGWYANSMTNRADGSWTSWGQIMIDHYYTKF
jgi:Cellulase (glycosyl hydrolase family 5)